MATMAMATTSMAVAAAHSRATPRATSGAGNHHQGCPAAETKHRLAELGAVGRWIISGGLWGETFRRANVGAWKKRVTPKAMGQQLLQRITQRVCTVQRAPKSRRKAADSIPRRSGGKLDEYCFFALDTGRHALYVLNSIVRAGGRFFGFRCAGRSRGFRAACARDHAQQRGLASSRKPLLVAAHALSGRFQRRAKGLVGLGDGAHVALVLLAHARQLGVAAALQPSGYSAWSSRPGAV